MKQRKSYRPFKLVAGLLALTVLSCSSAAGLPNLFATATPTPTNTFTPSPTLTPSPTATSTHTPSPSNTPLPAGVKTEEQSDGSTLFADYDNNFQLTLPQNWIVIPLSAEDLSQILDEMAAEDPALEEIADAFTQLDPDVIRAMAVNKDRKYIADGFSTNLSVTAIEDPLMSTMPIDFVTGAVEESIEQQGAELLSSGNTAVTNASGVEVGSFDFQQSTPSATGENILVRSKVILFQANGKVILVQLTTPQEFGEELVPIMDQIQDSISLIEP